MITIALSVVVINPPMNVFVPRMDIRLRMNNIIKRFDEREITDAINYSLAGGQSLHIWTPYQVWIDRAPLVFKKAAQNGGKWAHLFDQDTDRLIKTAKKYGVSKIFVHQPNTRSQHIDMCGKPLQNLIDSIPKPTVVKHPAQYPQKILDILKEILPPGIVLDPFGGSGRIGSIRSDIKAVSLEIEPEWASQGYNNGCSLCIKGDASSLPFLDNSIPTICTSPAYGNRMADHDASQLRTGTDKRKSDLVRSTYTSYLGRKLHSHSSGQMYFGDSYKELHRKVWRECFRVLQPKGLLVVNCKDHYKTIKGISTKQEVCQWHWDTLEAIGFKLVEIKKIPLKGNKNTNMMRSNGKPTVDYEELSIWTVPSLKPRIYKTHG